MLDTSWSRYLCLRNLAGMRSRATFAPPATPLAGPWRSALLEPARCLAGALWRRVGMVPAGSAGRFRLNAQNGAPAPPMALRLHPPQTAENKRLSPRIGRVGGALPPFALWHAVCGCRVSPRFSPWSRPCSRPSRVPTSPEVPAYRGPNVDNRIMED